MTENTTPSPRQSVGVRVNPVKTRAAFTLAEVLIVIVVIGVVAALTIPALITHFDTIVNKNRKEVIEDRLLEGMNQLNTLDAGFEASQYEDTEGFVRALSKYYKMSQICGAEDIKNCFPYETIKYTDEEGNEATASVEDLKTAEALKLNPDEWLAPAGFITAQGTPFVIFLNKSCTRDTEQAMQAIPTNCVQYMYDRNGSNNPNKLGKDIVHSLDMGIGAIASSGGSSKVEPTGTLQDPIGSYTTYLVLGNDYLDAEGKGLNTCDKIGQEGMGDEVSCQDNKWAAAKKACEDAGYELPSLDMLPEIYCRIKGPDASYVYSSNSSDYYSCYRNNLDNTLAENTSQISEDIISFHVRGPNGVGVMSLDYGVIEEGWHATYMDPFQVVCLGN